jgi:hypothetical protein
MHILLNASRYARGLIEESIRPSWVAANGLLGALLAGAMLIWCGVLPIVSSDPPSVLNWTLSFSIYAICAWIFLFILNLFSVAPFRIWRREYALRRKAEALVDHPLIDIGRSFLYSEQPNGETWKEKITSTKSIGGVQVCLDYSAYSGGLGHNFWNPKRRLVLITRIDFVKDAQVSIGLMEIDNSGLTRFWRWKANTDGNDRLLSLKNYRCQLVFIAEQETVDYFDFLVNFHDDTPSLIGEHLFTYARDWKTTK